MRNVLLWLSMVTAGCSAACAAEEPDGLIASPEPDWPQWRGPRRDGVSHETGLLAAWPAEGPKLLWKINDLGRGWSSPIIVGKRLYVTGDRDGQLKIDAFDLAGKRVWTAANGEAWNRSFPGARACCAYSKGRLYHLNAHGRLACLAADSGRELWSCSLVERFGAKVITWGLSESLLVDGPRVIVTPCGDRALMAALDAGDGRAVWTTPPLADDQASHAAPILFRCGGRRVIAGCSGKRGLGVDADSGQRLWTVPLENRYFTNVATPVYHDGAVFFTTAYSGGACYRLPSAANARQLSPLWTTTLDACTASVTCVDGQLYGSGYRNHKSWLLLDWRTGKACWESRALTSGEAVYADGRLYCLAEDGRVGLVNVSASGFELVSQFRLTTEKARDYWAHPVLFGGRLYLRYHDALWCYAVK